jgi:Glycine rich protein
MMPLRTISGTPHRLIGALGVAGVLFGVVVSMPVAAGAAVALAAVPAGCTVSRSTTTCSFASIGAEDQFVVPPGVSTIDVVAIGGAGGGDTLFFPTFGGRGALVRAVVAVSPGETLYVEVGGAAQSDPNSCDTDADCLPGFNGGGSLIDPSSGAGGGASDIRTSPASATGSLLTRLIVAAGGGGAGRWGACVPDAAGPAGGAGGDAGMSGAAGENCLAAPGGTGGSPGTATAGGTAGVPGGGDGSLGLGGLGEGSGAGGGGLYGGGGGGTPSGTPDGLGHTFSSAGGGGGGSNLVPSGGSAVLTAAASSITITYSAAIVTPTPTRTSPAASPAQSSSGPALAATGPRHDPGLIEVAAALIATGLALMAATSRRGH